MLQRSGRPTAAVSIHMCVVEKINSGLHLSGRPVAAVSIHMCFAEQIN